MTPQTRPFHAFFLAALLVLTGQSIALARGLPGPAGQMVICTGSGPIMVTIDADGVPTGETHLCPDLALSLIQAAFDSPGTGAVQALTPLAYTSTKVETVRRWEIWRQKARGPPRFA